MDVTLLDQSAFQQLLSVFIAGVTTSLTPCVYPLIPVTLAIFGATADVPRRRAFLLAVVYVLGIACTYTALGMFSAKTGAIFGTALTHPVVVFSLVALMVFLALFTLDMLHIGAVSRLQTKASKIGGRGFRGAFLMGTVSGLVAAPCAGPWLVVVLSIAARSQNTAWGAVLLFTYAMGMGMLFIALGLFPSLTKRLPRSGNWLNWVKLFMAIALLSVALFLAQPYLSAARGLVTQVGLVVVAPALLLLGFGAAAWGMKHSRAVGRLVGAVCLSLVVFVTFIAPPVVAGPVTWASGVPATVEQAKLKQTEAKKSVVLLVDLYADWCAACKELDEITFKDPEVAAKLASFATGRVDFTTPSTESDEITEKYGVLGLPCLLFLRPDGSEIPESRITGFLPPKEFLSHLDRVLSRDP